MNFQNIEFTVSENHVIGGYLLFCDKHFRVLWNDRKREIDFSGHWVALSPPPSGERRTSGPGRITSVKESYTLHVLWR